MIGLGRVAEREGCVHSKSQVKPSTLSNSWALQTYVQAETLASYWWYLLQLHTLFQETKLRQTYSLIYHITFHSTDNTDIKSSL
jgi:hypothetical protein